MSADLFRAVQYLARPLCCYCRRLVAAHGYRGLCARCYKDRSIRQVIPRLRDNLPDLSEEDKERMIAEPTQLPEPTRARPGSPEKVEELARRYQAGQRLWHPLDATAEGEQP